MRKLKAVTFSYDDGVKQDRRLIQIFNRYGLKGTFNIPSGQLNHCNLMKLPDGTYLPPEEYASVLREVYRGHEVAGHTLTHPNLNCDVNDDAEIIRQVEDDRLQLGELMGYEIVGMAYPGGGINYNEHVAEIIREHTGAKYARTTVSTHSFAPNKNLYTLHPTGRPYLDEFNKMFELAHEFIALEPDTPQIFYIWGHAYEFDREDSWERMEEFCRLISGHDDIFYGTNKEVILSDQWE